MVEYYPATVEIGVRFPDDAHSSFFFFDFSLFTFWRLEFVRSGAWRVGACCSDGFVKTNYTVVETGNGWLEAGGVWCVYGSCCLLFHCLMDHAT